MLVKAAIVTGAAAVAYAAARAFVEAPAPSRGLSRDVLAGGSPAMPAAAAELRPPGELSPLERGIRAAALRTAEGIVRREPGVLLLDGRLVNARGNPVELTWALTPVDADDELVDPVTAGDGPMIRAAAIEDAVNRQLGGTYHPAWERQQIRDDVADKYDRAVAAVGGAVDRASRQVPEGYQATGEVPMTPDERNALEAFLAFTLGDTVHVCTAVLTAVAMSAPGGAFAGGGKGAAAAKMIGVKTSTFAVSAAVCEGIGWVLNKLGLLEPMDRFFARVAWCVGSPIDCARAVGDWVADCATSPLDCASGGLAVVGDFASWVNDKLKGGGFIFGPFV